MVNAPPEGDEIEDTIKVLEELIRDWDNPSSKVRGLYNGSYPELELEFRKLIDAAIASEKLTGKDLNIVIDF